MDAIFFRFLAAEIGPLLQQKRVEKIFGPSPGVWTFKIQSTGNPLHLLFKPAKTTGLLFISPVKPANPERPTAQTMWFRKHLQGRRLLGHHIDWANLRMAWELTPSRVNTFSFLLFDLRNDVTLCSTLPKSFKKRIEWPAFHEVLENNEIWREYPQISPPLRKYLRSQPEGAAHKAYIGIASGTSQHFSVLHAKKADPPVAWQLNNPDQQFATALEAANSYGAKALFTALDQLENKESNTQLKREKKRLYRNLAKLDQEAKKLQKYIDNKVLAESLQAQLYAFKHMENLESIKVEHPEHGEMDVPLNRFLSPTENMEHYFKLAAKGTRGLQHIARRRNQLMGELESLEQGNLPQKRKGLQKEISVTIPRRYKNIPVALFKTSDGFTVLRGKNKRANHDIISKAASAFDYWFHLADGPSSHVILRRDHPAQEVPEESLNQAAALCALKSFRKEDKKATVLYAQVKDVRKVKGFSHGQVRVDALCGTIHINLDFVRDLEKQLEIHVSAAPLY